ncbi:hypothetical protein GCM10022286_12790 [Gryllotalpicola daejeonensis]|uniref:PPM-type phosphatase domain-containing protein n=1 Tax=Gryllotalpicola daejeonensis TaxID=993087 RepID=A0ABP7ZIA2_9MICO
MNRASFLGNTLVRQTPIAVIFALAAVFGLVIPEIPVTSMPTFVVGMAIAAVATGLAFVPVHSRLGTALFTIVPGIDFIAIALLRTTTGDSASVFTALVVLPVFWVSGSEGRRYVVFGVVGSMFVILAPLALDPGSGLSSADLTRVVVYLIVFSTVSGAVNALTARSRLRVRLAQQNEGQVLEEIGRAAAVQRSLLPDANLTIGDDISVAGTCQPATSVGGDFFDWYDTGSGVAITLGDVMGKGVGAGLIAAAVRASVRSAYSVDDPAEALQRASDGLEVASDVSDITFTTLFHARLSTDGVLHWADAGHGLSAIFRADGTVDRLASQNLPLGLQVVERWHTKTTRLDPGDVLVSVSDGVLDLWSGVDEAIEGMNAISREDSDPNAIVAKFSALAAQIPHDDDITVVAVRREPLDADREPLDAERKPLDAEREPAAAAGDAGAAAVAA